MFRGKDNGVRLQGVLTKEGGACFEIRRQALAALYKRIMRKDPVTVSDADVIEYLARGAVETLHYLQDQKRVGN